MNETDIHWLAGILDGRGCFVQREFDRNGKKYRQFYLKFTGTPNYIKELKKQIGGTVDIKGKHHQLWIMGRVRVKHIANSVKNLLKVRKGECTAFLQNIKDYELKMHGRDKKYYQKFGL